MGDEIRRSSAGCGQIRISGAEAKFVLYNFHAQEQAEALADLFLSKRREWPNVIELFGENGSGRHYLLRSAAYNAFQRGTRIHVAEVGLDGYEPDAPLSNLLKYLSSRSSGEANHKLKELAQRAKVEIKISAINFLFASLALKGDFTVEELLHFFESTSQTPGPTMSEREALGLFLKRLTEKQRFLMHLRNAHTVPKSLLLRLIDESELNAEVFVAFSYPPGYLGASKSRREYFTCHIPAWTREEMKRAFTERFRFKRYCPARAKTYRFLRGSRSL